MCGFIDLYPIKIFKEVKIFWSFDQENEGLNIGFIKSFIKEKTNNSVYNVWQEMWGEFY